MKLHLIIDDNRVRLNDDLALTPYLSCYSESNYIGKIRGTGERVYIREIGISINWFFWSFIVAISNNKEKKFFEIRI